MTYERNEDKTCRKDLIPSHVLDALGNVLAYGAKKHGCDCAWRDESKESYFSAAVHRHLLTWEYYPIHEKSGQSSLAHAMAYLMFLMDLEYMREQEKELKK
jgi:hypothetical protein